MTHHASRRDVLEAVTAATAAPLLAAGASCAGSRSSASSTAASSGSAAPGSSGASARLLLALAVCVVACSGTTHQVAPTPVAAPLTAYPGGRWAPGPAAYGTVVVDDVPVTMDDRVVLRASVAFPAELGSGQRARGRFPVVIEHTPYTRLRAPIVPNAFFPERGYIYAVVRARGTGTSGGEVQMRAPREGQDGKAIVEWAAHQLEGSDGRVAIVGCSWPGAIALTDAAAVGPDSPVKAVVAACVGLEGIQRQSWLIGGLPTMGFWTFAGTGAGMVGDTPAARRFFIDIAREVSAGGDAAYDGNFWRERNPMSLARRIVDNGIPVLLWAGWSDVGETAVLRTYVALQNASSGRPVDAAMTTDQPVTSRYQLVVGGWRHAQGLDAGIVLEWLDTWLNGADTGLQRTTTPMHLYESGADRWINVARYPLVSGYASWALSADGQLAQSGVQDGTARLVWGAPAGPDSHLSFTSAPWADGGTLAGPISATLYASSSNTNLELIAQLYDVAPDGAAVLVSRGAILGSLRELDPEKSWRDDAGAVIWPWPRLRRDDYLTPGEVVRLDVALAPRQWVVQPGHGLRLDLTTQTPIDRCPESGPPAENEPSPCRLTDTQRATVPGGVYTLRFGPGHASTLNLPQLPRNAFHSVRTGVPPTPWNESSRRIADPAQGDPIFALPLDWGTNDKDKAR